MFAANEHAKNVLGDFLVSAGQETRTLSDFQKAYTILRGLGRFLAMVTHFEEQNPGALDGGVGLVKGITGQSVKESRHDVRHLASTNDGVGNSWQGVKGSHTELEKAMTGVGPAQEAAIGATHDVSAAISDLEAGIVQRMAAAPEKRNELSALTKKTSMIKSLVNKGLSLVADKVPGGEKVTEFVVDHVVDEIFSKELRGLERDIGVADQHQSDHAHRVPIERLRAALSKWAKAMMEYQAATKRLADAKNSMRASSTMMAETAENTDWNFEISLLASFFGEADALAAQCHATIDLGVAEQSASSQAKTDAQRVTGTKSTKWKDALVYYEPVRSYHDAMRGWLDPRSIGLTYDAMQHHAYILMRSSYGRSGYSEGANGVNPVMDSALAELRDYQKTIVTVRNRLGDALALGKMGQGGGRLGSAPTHANRNEAG